jgi:hypothetical protein
MGVPRSDWKNESNAGAALERARAVHVHEIGCTASSGCLHVYATGPEIDIVPAQHDQLTHPQAVPIGHQDRGTVALTVVVAAGRPDHQLDLIFQ